MSRLSKPQPYSLIYRERTQDPEEVGSWCLFIYFFKKNIYLFGCPAWHVGYSSLMRDQTLAPCFGTAES